MTKEEIDALLAYYSETLGPFPGERCEVDKVHPGKSKGDSHLLYMIETMQADIMPSFHEPKIRDKAMRWLGFIQGALWAHGTFTIDELKNHNKYGVPRSGGGNL